MNPPEQQNPNPKPEAPKSPEASRPELDRNAVLLGTVDAVQIALARIQLNGKKELGQLAHCAMLARLVACLFEVKRDDARIIRLYTLLKENGLGANNSQHVKWLATDKGGKVLPPAEKKASSTADELLA